MSADPGSAIKPDIHIVSFSGGKDSTALLLWAKENLPDFTAVWMDTGWESPITYAYVDLIDRMILGGSLVRLSSSEYNGFRDLCAKKGRVPSTKARFCTQHLKLNPLAEYFDTLRDRYVIHNYIGIRAQESHARSKMPDKNFDLDWLGCWMHRPLLAWTADDVFEMHRKHRIPPNPLYKLGMKRVGCMPCIMANHTDMRQIIKHMPEVIENIREIELELDSSFFPPKYIPDRYCSRSIKKRVSVKTKVENDLFFENKTILRGEKEVEAFYPMIDDVVKYLADNPDQLTFDREPQSCMSHYNICE